MEIRLIMQSLDIAKLFVFCNQLLGHKSSHRTRRWFKSFSMSVALVQWLWEKTLNQEVVSLNPGNGPWKDIHHINCCQNCIIWLKSLEKKVGPSKKMFSKLDLLRELVLVVVPSKFIQMGQTKPLFINFSPFQTTFYRKKHFTAKKLFASLWLEFSW